MTKDIQFPDKWDEITPEEFKIILYTYKMIIEHSEFDVIDFNRYITLSILNKRGYKIDYHSDEDYYLIDKLSHTLSWMWAKDDDGKNLLNVNTLKNLLPNIGKLYGWKDYGADLTFKEFRSAVAVMNDIARLQDTSLLTVLCAILYRPKVDGVRVPFDENKMDWYLSLVEKEVPPALLAGIYMQFAFFCQYLRKDQFVIEGNTISFAELFPESESNSDKQNIGMLSILYSVAESGVFGKTSEVDDTPLLMVLLKLLNDKQRYDETMKAINNK